MSRLPQEFPSLHSQNGGLGRLSVVNKGRKLRESKRLSCRPRSSLLTYLVVGGISPQKGMSDAETSETLAQHNVHR